MDFEDSEERTTVDGDQKAFTLLEDGEEAMAEDLGQDEMTPFTLEGQKSAFLARKANSSAVSRKIQNRRYRKLQELI